jgi:REP element-mobilizing transposase RayT
LPVVAGCVAGWLCRLEPASFFTQLFPCSHELFTPIAELTSISETVRRITLQPIGLLSMPSAPRILFPKSVIFVTSRTEIGLPLVSGPLMNTILKSILARAQSLYPVNLCHYLFMGNHFHMLIVVEDPNVTMHFIERIKTESAHAINKLLGNRRRTVWCAGYDAEPILTPDDVIEKIAYLYTNPQRSGLVDSIEEYPGASSWGAVPTEDVPWIPRSTIKPLPALSLTEHQQRRALEALVSDSPSTHPLQLSPQAWLRTFRLEAEEVKIQNRIHARVREIERKLSIDRESQRKSTLGSRRLIIQPFNLPFVPKKFARRMWCICSDKMKRIAFVEFVKKLRTAARNVYLRWRTGDRKARYPAGMFPPRFPTLESLVFGV